MRVSRIALILAMLVGIGLAQFPWGFSNPPRNLVHYTQYIPNSATDLATSTRVCDYISLTNKAATATTVNIKDKSTNCNSGVCEFLDGVSLAADSLTIIEMKGGHWFNGGITWDASAANSVSAQLHCTQY